MSSVLSHHLLKIIPTEQKCSAGSTHMPTALKFQASVYVKQIMPTNNQTVLHVTMDFFLVRQNVSHKDQVNNFI